MHVFTDLSLRLVLREFDTITDLVNYLHNRASFFRGPRAVSVRGEEELIALYFRGYSNQSKNYDIARAIAMKGESPHHIWIDGGFYDEMIKRPEYIARRERNKVSYLWDALIERFAVHQVQGTSSQIRPQGFEHHEGGIRLMALESRVSRRSHSEQLLHTINNFRDDRDIAARIIMPDRAHESPAYLFLQLLPPSHHSYDDYRQVRAYLLQIYAKALLHDYPAISQVVGIATEPPKLYARKRVSEDMVFAMRSMLTPEQLMQAKREKTGMGFGTITASGTWNGQEFPTP